MRTSYPPVEMIKLTPKKALNKAFLRTKPRRDAFEAFKIQLVNLLDCIDAEESEEFHKNLVRDFLKNVYYDPEHSINTKGRNDLVIHNGKDSKSSVGVIIEAKKPSNKLEMVRIDAMNVKAFQELILYYLRERITVGNFEVRHLVATNIYEWFIFDANFFEKEFAQNRPLVDQFREFEAGRLSGKNTEFFYKEIACVAIDKISQIEFTHFDIRDYDKTLRNEDKVDDRNLIALFKLLSPEHLLKLPFINDSNSLNKGFYVELLHIIGLSEVADAGKKLIGRKSEGHRDSGSLIENAIVQLVSMDKLRKLDHIKHFGVTKHDRLFSVSLELVITWINRILFLKLLEAQLIAYHPENKNYSFLNLKKIKNFDDLNSLFFQVLACRPEDRHDDIKADFSHVPYLNSSLFEITDIEDETLLISNLNGNKNLPVLPSTVLKDNLGKKISGELNTLEYLFEFLNSYDFASTGSENIQEENKSLISASVLGLIFEKINGYRDGAFFTPGFVTMYMCRESLRRAIVEKFNEKKKWHCTSISDLYNKIEIEDRHEANSIINGMTICDPAVGSGHFLVSALNEIIAIKSDLNILVDRSGRRLKEYKVEVINDELILTDDDGGLFDYRPGNKESQRVQETIFHEKQTIIENCLFGVDINPNSVKICRLRLWIELLKTAYYKPNNQLETLPNIDINIKCGNSLVSRFALNTSLKDAFKKSKNSLKDYRLAIATYRDANSKEQKREMEKIISEIKQSFRLEMYSTDPKIRDQRILTGELKTLMGQGSLFIATSKVKEEREKKKSELEKKIRKLDQAISDIENNIVYENAFEWRFEFAEALNEDGDFIGFDVCIGNPPWGAGMSEAALRLVKLQNQDIVVRMVDTFMFFLNLCLKLKSETGLIAQIVPDVLLYQIDNEKLRQKILDKYQLYVATNLGDNIFEDVARACCVVVVGSQNTGSTEVAEFRRTQTSDIQSLQKQVVATNFFKDLPNTIFATKNISGYSMLSKVLISRLSDFVDSDGIQRGVSPDLKDAFIVDEATIVAAQLEKSFIHPTATGGRDIKRYYAGYTGRSVIYTRNTSDANKIPNIIKHIEKYHSRITCREVLDRKHEIWALHRARDPKIFDKKEKVLGVITGDKISTSLDSGKLYPTDGLYVFASNGIYTNTFLVGLLNSGLLTYFYRLLSMEQGRTLAQIKPSVLAEMPVSKNFDSATVSKIESLTNTIINKVKIGNNLYEAEVREIDILVYSLYDLSEQEIETVEIALM